MIEIILDIETIPNQNLKYYHYDIINRKNKDNEDIDILNKYCSLNPEFSQIICICININDNTIAFINKDENKVLLDFYEFLGEFKSNEIKLITFNGKKFDIPTILKRACILKIIPTIKLTNKRYDVLKHYDCLEILSNFYYDKNVLTLQEYAKIFNIENNDVSKGCQVYSLYKENNLEEIKNHCFEDIQTTQKLYKMLNIYF